MCKIVFTLFGIAKVFSYSIIKKGLLKYVHKRMLYLIFFNFSNLERHFFKIPNINGNKCKYGVEIFNDIAWLQ